MIQLYINITQDFVHRNAQNLDRALHTINWNAERDAELEKFAIYSKEPREYLKIHNFDRSPNINVLLICPI